MPLTGAGTSRRKRLLMVFMRGGAPLEYAMPRIAARAEVHMLTLQPLAPDLEAVCRRYCASIIDGREACHSQDAVTGRVIAEAQRLRADGLLTLSEVCVIPVAQAAGYLGLPGPAATRSEPGTSGSCARPGTWQAYRVRASGRSGAQRSQLPPSGS